jgi:hypothetical protein
MTEVRAPDGSRWGMWSEPVIGWAVVQRHFSGSAEFGHESRIEAVLLVEGEFPVTMTVHKEDLNMFGGHAHARLVRAVPHPS